MIPLITSSYAQPLRYINNNPVHRPVDPIDLLNDELEQYCALKQDEVTTKERIDNPAIVLAERSFDLKSQALSELDRLITILQLLTQTKWGNQETIRFLNVRSGAICRDPPCTLDLSSTIRELRDDISRSRLGTERNLSQSQEFAEVLIALRGVWPISEIDNQVLVDLLPLRSIIKSESPYLVQIFIDRSTASRGVCISIPPNIAPQLRARYRLSISLGSDAAPQPAHRHPPTATSRAAALHESLCELQRLSLDHAIFSALVKEAAELSSRKWVAMACGQNEIAFGDFSGRQVGDFRFVMMRYSPTVMAVTQREEEVKRRLTSLFLNNKPLLAYLLD